MIGDVERDGRYGQIWVTAKVLIGQHDLAEVLGISRVEPASEGIGCEAVLSAAGRRLQASWDIGMKAARRVRG